MAVLDPNEIFYTAFEPKQQNRFILYVDGIPSYQIKGMGAVSLTQGTVQLNHINVARYVKGKTLWNTIQMLYKIFRLGLILPLLFILL